jgi:MFS family permease
MVEAVGWLRWAPATLTLVLLGATASAFSFAYIPLLGAISRDVIHAGSAGLGTLTATSGIGMLASAVLANTVGIRLRRGRGVVITMCAGAGAMAALGASSVLAVSVVLVICVAFLSSTRSSLAQFLLQSLSPPRMRGRVASLADFIGQILTIAGSLGVGALAALFGPTPVIVGCGIAILTIVALIVVAWPRILAIDVDHDARPVIAGGHYTEGQRGGPVLESPPD